MTWIKICGTTNLEDALMSVEAGADALGFVFYENSPRNISPDDVREIVKKLPAKVEKIGVFVNGSTDRMENIVEIAGLTGTQLHVSVSSSESFSQWSQMAALQQRYLALPSDLEDLAGFRFPKKGGDPAQLPSAIFLDSGTPQQPGGTGKVFDWTKAMPVAGVIRRSGFKFVVAGGLDPDNVTEAIRILGPWGVDVVSGVEASPGKKDPAKVRAFVEAVRQTEQTK
ncbi:MAG: phosphoribosylanthranilate isomerase [Terriglobales bacterium]